MNHFFSRESYLFLGWSRGSPPPQKLLGGVKRRRLGALEPTPLPASVLTPRSFPIPAHRYWLGILVVFCAYSAGVWVVVDGGWGWWGWCGGGDCGGGWGGWVRVMVVVFPAYSPDAPVCSCDPVAFLGMPRSHMAGAGVVLLKCFHNLGRVDNELLFLVLSILVIYIYFSFCICVRGSWKSRRRGHC